MRIRSIKVEEKGNHVIVSAKCKIRVVGDDTVYFKLDKKYKDFISADASSFAAALLIPSMRRGEDLIIDGSISRELYNGLKQIMKIMVGWNIGVSTIKIKAKKITPDKFKPTKTASMFSGGVDSFYTYLSNKKKGNKIDYFILINGFDIELDNPDLWTSTFETVKKIADHEKVGLITVESNLYRLVGPVYSWDYSSGGCLASVMILLRKGLKKVYYPSSYRTDQLFPAGSHPLIDKYWSAEKLKVIHDGGTVSRFDKTQFIAKNKLVSEYLRVCYKNHKDIYNCGRCDKCLRTMIGLYIAGTLKNSKVFPKKINVNTVRKFKIVAEYSAIFQRENLAALEKTGKDPKLAAALRESLKDVPPIDATSRETFSRKVLYFDHIAALS